MDSGSSGKRVVEAPQEVGSIAKRLNVTMEVDTLDCPICYEPLRPPIFQCSVGHFICSPCHQKHLNKKCPSCSIQTSFKRCFGVEHIVQAVTVPCSNAKYGCIEKVTYYQKEEHEKVCQNTRCFCPESGCSFTGPAIKLLGHLIMKHYCMSTILDYHMADHLWVQPGLHVLRVDSNEVNHFFLLNTASEPFGYAISVTCVVPTVMESSLKCKMVYGDSRYGYCESSTWKIRSSSLFDGIPTGYDFILPKGKVYDDPRGIFLKIYIYREPKNLHY